MCIDFVAQLLSLLQNPSIRRAENLAIDIQQILQATKMTNEEDDKREM
jgi:hypothetical protein